VYSHEFRTSGQTITRKYAEPRLRLIVRVLSRPGVKFGISHAVASLEDFWLAVNFTSRRGCYPLSKLARLPRISGSSGASRVDEFCVYQNQRQSCSRVERVCVQPAQTAANQSLARPRARTSTHCDQASIAF
jgi:hypothetical protein